MRKLSQIQLFDGTGHTGFGTLGLAGSTTDAPSIFATFISSAVGLITVIGIIWFVFIFMSGAVAIITSSGDKGSVESAKKKITSGIIGITVSVLGLLLVRLIGNLIGIPNILNFGSMFSQLIIK
ncbi:hypothetical protein A2585_03195 [Candidatus Nomurabacteria bacterium RIFOXYD1_FULL_39_12]|nr:MAG: hypothetical protein A2585_03195 [Candidatus Nomurabacteria bacterium RIFOXYD1_FULL_39_12]